MQLFNLKEKTMSVYDHPRYVQAGMNRHVLQLILLIGITLAASLTFKAPIIFMTGGIMTLAYGAIVFHLYYSLTRDNFLCLNGYCHEILASDTIPIRRANRKKYIVVKPNDPANNNTYLIPYTTKLIFCNEGDSIDLYTFKSGIYVNQDDNIVISNPVFLKISK